MTVRRPLTPRRANPGDLPTDDAIAAADTFDELAALWSAVRLWSDQAGKDPDLNVFNTAGPVKRRIVRRLAQLAESDPRIVAEVARWHHHDRGDPDHRPPTDPLQAGREGTGARRVPLYLLARPLGRTVRRVARPRATPDDMTQRRPLTPRRFNPDALPTAADIAPLGYDELVATWCAVADYVYGGNPSGGQDRSEFVDPVRDLILERLRDLATADPRLADRVVAAYRTGRHGRHEPGDLIQAEYDLASSAQLDALILTDDGSRYLAPFTAFGRTEEQ